MVMVAYATSSSSAHNEYRNNVFVDLSGTRGDFPLIVIAPNTLIDCGLPNNDDVETVTNPHHYLHNTCIIDGGS